MSVDSSAQTSPAGRRGHRLRHLVGVPSVLMLSAVVGGWVGGCQTNPTTGAPGDGLTMRWPFWPVQMRVHPLTRIVRAEGAETGVLDLRIETSDPDGVEGRAVGILRIEVSPRNRRQGAAQPPISTTIDLVDPATNRRTFDTVTRTYHVMIALDWAEAVQPDRQIDVAVTLDGADGRTLRARGTLRWP